MAYRVGQQPRLVDLVDDVDGRDVHAAALDDVHQVVHGDRVVAHVHVRVVDAVLAAHRLDRCARVLIRNAPPRSERVQGAMHCVAAHTCACALRAAMASRSPAPNPGTSFRTVSSHNAHVRHKHSRARPSAGTVNERSSSWCVLAELGADGLPTAPTRPSSRGRQGPRSQPTRAGTMGSGRVQPSPRGASTVQVQARVGGGGGERDAALLLAPERDRGRLLVEPDAEALQLVLDQALVRDGLEAVQHDQDQVARSRRADDLRARGARAQRQAPARGRAPGGPARPWPGRARAGIRAHTEAPAGHARHDGAGAAKPLPGPTGRLRLVRQHAGSAALCQPLSVGARMLGTLPGPRGSARRLRPAPPERLHGVPRRCPRAPEGAVRSCMATDSI
jgi:hypothetical protein